jgi:hypothetical protein
VLRQYLYFCTSKASKLNTTEYTCKQVVFAELEGLMEVLEVEHHLEHLHDMYILYIYVFMSRA